MNTMTRPAMSGLERIMPVATLQQQVSHFNTFFIEGFLDRVITDANEQALATDLKCIYELIQNPENQESEVLLMSLRSLNTAIDDINTSKGNSYNFERNIGYMRVSCHHFLVALGLEKSAFDVADYERCAVDDLLSPDGSERMFPALYEEPVLV